MNKADLEAYYETIIDECTNEINDLQRRNEILIKNAIVNIWFSEEGR